MQFAIIGILVLNLIVLLLLVFQKRKAISSFDGVGDTGQLEQAIQTAAKDSRTMLLDGQRIATEQFDRMFKSIADNFRDERKELNERLSSFTTTLQTTMS